MLQMSRKWSLFALMSKEQSDTQMLLDVQEVENSSDEDKFTFFTVAILCKQSNSRLNKIGSCSTISLQSMCFVMPSC